MEEPDRSEGMAGGRYEEAFVLFVKMLCVGRYHNHFHLPLCVEASAAFPAMQEVAEIDNRVIKMGIDSDDHVETALANMYVKCSNTENAHNVFDKMFPRKCSLMDCPDCKICVE